MVWGTLYRPLPNLSQATASPGQINTACVRKVSEGFLLNTWRYRTALTQQIGTPQYLDSTLDSGLRLPHCPPSALPCLATQDAEIAPPHLACLGLVPAFCSELFGDLFLYPGREGLGQDFSQILAPLWALSDGHGCTSRSQHQCPEKRLLAQTRLGGERVTACSVHPSPSGISGTRVSVGHQGKAAYRTPLHPLLPDQYLICWCSVHMRLDTGLGRWRLLDSSPPPSEGPRPGQLQEPRGGTVFPPPLRTAEPRWPSPSLPAPASGAVLVPVPSQNLGLSFPFPCIVALPVISKAPPSLPLSQPFLRSFYSWLDQPLPLSVPRKGLSGWWLAAGGRVGDGLPEAGPRLQPAAHSSSIARFLN